MGSLNSGQTSFEVHKLGHPEEYTIQHKETENQASSILLLLIQVLGLSGFAL